MCRYGLVAEGVQDVAFGSYGGAFDLLFGVTGDEEEGGAGLWAGFEWQVSPGLRGETWGTRICGYALGGGCVPVFWLAVDDGGGDEGFAFGEGGRSDGGGVGRDVHFGGA